MGIEVEGIPSIIEINVMAPHEHGVDVLHVSYCAGLHLGATFVGRACRNPQGDVIAYPFRWATFDVDPERMEVHATMEEAVAWLVADAKLHQDNLLTARAAAAADADQGGMDA